MIGSLQAISPKSPEDEERIKQEIAALINKRRYLITNPNSLGTERSCMLLWWWWSRARGSHGSLFSS
jgi:hypothetical protein